VCDECWAEKKLHLSFLLLPNETFVLISFLLAAALLLLLLVVHIKIAKALEANGK